jgi:hypothetical protein
VPLELAGRTATVQVTGNPARSFFKTPARSGEEEEIEKLIKIKIGK